ncbi:hypothetical protein HY988_07575 [Candidatus Micrarchaeota archaeon]|nr:hypothetical protein [Candidatus Micrarchaeota archaeon]
MESLDFATKYPFSQEAKLFIKDLTLTERIVELAVERIKKAVGGQTTARMLLHETDKQEEIASFAAARMILGTLRNQFLTSRFAVNESKTARGYLDRETEPLAELVAARFGIITKKDGERLLVDLPSYLRCSPRDIKYRLINKKLINGFVEIKATEKMRLIEQAIKDHVEDIPLVRDPPELIKTAGAKIISEMPKSETRVTIKVENHPPCIEKLLEEMKRHQNLAHHARWYLATYLLAIGTSEDDVTKLYSDLPDFDEKITRYQVSHIKKKGYSVPSCATIMTYGLCCAVCRIGHPLNWHSLTKERKEAIQR